MRRSRVGREISMLTDDESLRDTIKHVRQVNDRTFHAVIHGPRDTPYADGLFLVEMYFPQQYPFVPPKCRFRTPIFHPNVDPSHGDVCLDILKTDWSPALTVTTVLLSLMSLMQDPNPDDPLAVTVADLLLRDPEAYEDTARLWTERFADGVFHEGPEPCVPGPPVRPPSPLGP